MQWTTKGPIRVVRAGSWYFRLLLLVGQLARRTSTAEAEAAAEVGGRGRCAHTTWERHLE